MLKRMLDTLQTTYKTRENAIKAVEKKFANIGDDVILRYVIVATEDGRFAPCLVGTESIQYAVAGDTPCVA